MLRSQQLTFPVALIVGATAVALLVTGVRSSDQADRDAALRAGPPATTRGPAALTRGPAALAPPSVEASASDDETRDGEDVRARVAALRPLLRGERQLAALAELERSLGAAPADAAGPAAPSGDPLETARRGAASLLPVDRSAAGHALARLLPRPEARAAILLLLDDPETMVRLSAVHALASCSDATQPAIDRLDRESQTEVQVALLALLGRRGDPRDAARLHTWLGHAVVADEVAAACRAIYARHGLAEPAGLPPALTRAERRQKLVLGR